MGSSPTFHPQTSFGMSFFCIVACSLRHSLSVSPSVSVSKLPIRLYYPLKSWQMSHYTKNRWMWGLLNLGSCSFLSLRSALRAVRAPHSTLRHPWRDVFFVTHLLKKWDNFRHLPKWFSAKWPNEIAPTRWLKIRQLGDLKCTKFQNVTVFRNKIAQIL